MKTLIFLVQLVAIVKLTATESSEIGIPDINEMCKHLNKKLLLEEGVTQYGTSGTFPGHSNIDLDVVIPMTDGFDAGTFFPDPEWFHTTLDLFGVQPGYDLKAFGDVYIQGPTYVYVPRISPNVYFNFERDFYERVLFRSVAKFRILLFVDVDGVRARLNKMSLDYMNHFLPHFGGGLKLGVAMHGSPAGSVSAVFAPYEAAIKEATLNCEDCPHVRFYPRETNDSIWLLSVGKYGEPFHVRTTKVTPRDPLSPFQDTVLKNVERKMRCLFGRFFNELKWAIDHDSDIRPFDVARFENIQTSMDVLTVEMEATSSYVEAFRLVKESNVQDYVTYPLTSLTILNEFLEYYLYMTEVFEADYGYDLETLIYFLEEANTVSDKILEWKRYTQEIFNLVLHERGSEVEALLETDVDEEEFRTSMCTEFANCWEDRFTQKQIDQIEDVRNRLKPRYFCEDDIMKISGMSVTTTDIGNVTDEFLPCPFHTIFVVALNQFRIEENIYIPSRNLIVFAPNWVAEGKYSIILSAVDIEREELFNSPAKHVDEPGYNGGNFLGYLSNYEGHEVMFASSGGKGSKGRSSTPDVFDPDIAEIVDGACTKNEKQFKKLWRNQGPTKGGLGGRKGEINIISLQEGIGLESKITGSSVDGEHGDPGEAFESRIHCTSETFFTYKPEEFVSAEGPRRNHPPFWKEQELSKVYKIEFKKLLEDVNPFLDVGSLDIIHDEEENTTGEMEKMNALLHKIFDFLAGERSEQKMDPLMDEVNQYIEDAGMSFLSTEDKIQLAYIHAILAVKNAQNNPFRPSLKVDLESYLHLSLAHVQTLKDLETVWDVQFLENDIHRRYLATVETSREFEKNVLSDLMNTLLARIFEILMTDIRERSYDNFHASKQLEMLEQIRALLVTEIYHGNSPFGRDWVNEKISHIFLDLIGNDSLPVSSEYPEKSESTEEVPDKPHLPLLWGLLVIGEALREVTFDWLPERREAKSMLTDMEVLLSVLKLDQKNIFNQNVSVYFPVDKWVEQLKSNEEARFWGAIVAVGRVVVKSVVKKVSKKVSQVVQKVSKKLGKVVEKIVEGFVMFPYEIPLLRDSEDGNKNFSVSPYWIEIDEALKLSNWKNKMSPFDDSSSATPSEGREYAESVLQRTLKDYVPQPGGKESAAVVDFSTIFGIGESRGAMGLLGMAVSSVFGETYLQAHGVLNKAVEKSRDLRSLQGNIRKEVAAEELNGDKIITHNKKFMNHQKMRLLGKVIGRIVGKKEVYNDDLKFGETEMSLFQSYVVHRVRDSTYLYVKPSENLEITKDVNNIVWNFQRYENERLLRKTIAIRSFITILKQFLNDYGDVSEKCPDCVQFFQELENEIDQINGKCFDNSALPFEPITSWKMATQKMQTDGDEHSSPYTCNPGEYVESYLELVDKLRMKLDAIQSDIPDEQLLLILKVQDEILTLLEIAQRSEIGDKLIYRFFSFFGADGYNSSVFHQFFDKDTDTSFYDSLQADIWNGELLSPGTLPLNIVFNTILKKLSDIHRWVTHMLFLEEPFDILSHFVPAVQAGLLFLQRTLVEVKNLNDIKDISHYLEIINENRPAVSEVWTVSVKEQIDKLDKTLRIELSYLRYKQARDSFNEYVFPFAKLFSSYLDSTSPPSSPGVDPEKVIEFYENRIEALVNMMKNHIKITKSMEGEVISSYHFDPESCNTCRPFYTWTIADVENSGYELSDFLNGKPITLLADIRKSTHEFEAIKGRSFGIRFVSVSMDHQRVIDEHFDDCYVVLVHHGLSYTSYGGRMYVFSSTSTHFERSYSKNASYMNAAYKKSTEPVLSPFAWWMIRLICPEPFAGQVGDLIGGIQLVGKGQYVNTYLKNLKPDLYYRSNEFTFGNETLFLTIQ